MPCVNGSKAIPKMDAEQFPVPAERPWTITSQSAFTDSDVNSCKQVGLEI